MVKAPELVPVLIHGRHRAKVGLHPALHGHLAIRSICQYCAERTDACTQVLWLEQVKHITLEVLCILEL